MSVQFSGLLFGCILILGACADGGGMRVADAGATDSERVDVPGADVPTSDVPTSDVADSGPTVTDTGPGVDAELDGGPGVDGGPPPMDAGTDAFDAGNDAGPSPDVPVFDAGCSGDEACDNGDACDGMERCIAGSCEEGTPIVCNDDVTCTVDSCVPATGECQSTPNNSMCASPLICTLTGCTSPGCGESPCRLVSPQCGCPSGQACYITGMDERVCAPEGTAATGESCNDSEICESGNVCISMDGAGTITMCRAFCDSDADCVGGVGALCVVTVTGTTQNICTTHCNPATNEGCPTDTGCSLYTDGTGRRLSDCNVTGSLTQGEICVDRSECATGFDCYDTGDQMECLRTCRRASPVGGECLAYPGTTCVATAGAAFDGTEYGACL